MGCACANAPGNLPGWVDVGQSAQYDVPSKSRSPTESNVGAGEKLTLLRRLRFDPPMSAEASGVIVSLA